MMSRGNADGMLNGQSFFSSFFSAAFSFFSLKRNDFALGLLEFLGPILAGQGDAEGQLFAVELVEALRGLPLGLLGSVVDDEVDRGVGLGLRVDLDLAGVIDPVDARLERLALEGPLGIDARRPPPRPRCLSRL